MPSIVLIVIAVLVGLLLLRKGIKLATRLMGILILAGLVWLVLMVMGIAPKFWQ